MVNKINSYSSSKKLAVTEEKSVTISAYLIILGTLFLVAYLIGDSFDRSMDNKDQMLCNSALQSGNEVYTNKCVCYYSGDFIRCIYKEKNK